MPITDIYFAYARYVDRARFAKIMMSKYPAYSHVSQKKEKYELLDKAMINLNYSDVNLS